jgi:phosphate transport system substrate-binding protein
LFCFIVAAAGLAITLSSCARQPGSVAAAPHNGLLLKGAGATFPSVLYKQWFATYQKSHPQVEVSYDAVGSGEGVRRFIGSGVKEDERIDFGASDAAMTDEQMAQVPGGVTLLPMTGGCVTLSYNLPGLQGDLRLSRQAYAAIFSGKVRNWNDPLITQSNPDVTLPKITLVTVVRQDASGTTFAFTKHLDAINDDWRNQYGAATLVNWPDAMRAEGSEGVAGRIQHSEGAIGYVGYEFAHRLGLKMALLENKSGAYVAPTKESCSAALASAEMPNNLRVYVPDPQGASSYPIVTFSWILLYRHYDSQQASAIRDLFAWCLRSGQQVSGDLGYVPLPANVTTRAMSELETLN